MVPLSSKISIIAKNDVTNRFRALEWHALRSWSRASMDTKMHLHQETFLIIQNIFNRLVHHIGQMFATIVSSYRSPFSPLFRSLCTFCSRYCPILSSFSGELCKAKYCNLLMLECTRPSLNGRNRIGSHNSNS